MARRAVRSILRLVKLAALVLTGAAAVLVIAALALATARHPVWTARLSAAQEVQPVQNRAAHGVFTGTLSQGVLTWKLTYAKLTGPAIAANVYKGARGQIGTVGVPLCAHSHPACESGVTGTFRITTKVKHWIDHHLLYVNIHTARYPNGEIRGQITVR
jgi:hypothetical protein